MSKLVASAQSIESLESLLSDKVFYSHITIKKNFSDSIYWNVYNSSGVIEGIYVVKRGNRYRLERE